jgi:small subunit ribosomal protein S20
MANTKSSEKRIKVNERNRLENRTYKGNIKSTIKKYVTTLELYETSKTPENREKVEELLKTAYSQIDKATKKNVFHKNKAARKKSQLAGYLKAI